jgi:hypothetical protein
MTTDDTKPRYGSVYARGYYDGLRAAGVTDHNDIQFMSRSRKDQERLMSVIDMAAKQGSTSPSSQTFQKPQEITQARFTSVFNGLSAVLKQVYECVPINDRWTVEQVTKEFSRKVATKPASEVKKLLNSLHSNGLIINDAGIYRRVKVTGNPSALSIVKPVIQNNGDSIVKTKPAGSTPKEITAMTTVMDGLARIAENARTLAQDMKALADDIDEAALNIEAEFEVSESKSEKLKQLQLLLKGITD